MTKNELAREEETPEGIFKVARTGRDLYDISEKLHNCVRIYVDKMLRKDCTIYCLQKEDKFLACIEVRNGAVVQASGMCNKKLSGYLLDTVISWSARNNLVYAVS